MIRRFSIPSLVYICVALPTGATAQPAPAILTLPTAPTPLPETVEQPAPTAPLNPPSPTFAYSGMGLYGQPKGIVHHGRYPTPPPTWSYGNLPGNFLTFDYPKAGWPGYRPPFCNFRPQVPVYLPIRESYGGPDTLHHLATRRSLGGFGGLGLGYYGWFGPYRASPRPYPPSVNPWPRLTEPTFASVDAAPPADQSCLHLSMKVPQPNAEIIVGGIKTLQTGTDRLYESPPLEAGKNYSYEIVARWVEGGARVERKKTVVGKAGETIRLDLTAP